LTKKEMSLRTLSQTTSQGKTSHKGGEMMKRYIVLAAKPRTYIFDGAEKETPIIVRQFFTSIPEGINFPGATSRPCLVSIQIGKLFMDIMNQGGQVWLDVYTEEKDAVKEDGTRLQHLTDTAFIIGVLEARAGEIPSQRKYIDEVKERIIQSIPEDLRGALIEGIKKGEKDESS